MAVTREFTEAFSVQCTPEMKNMLRRFADEFRISEAQVVRSALQQWLGSLEATEARPKAPGGQ
jgi:hypothetical protein